MSKFTQLNKGTFVRTGKEYDYIIEVADDFPKKKTGNIRLRIIEERPIIKKIRTRYDPEIEMFGDKNAQMDVMLGYDMKQVESTIKGLKHAFLMPVYSGLFVGFLYGGFKLIDAVPSGFLPKWVAWLLIPVVILGLWRVSKLYLSLVLPALAEYWKAKELKKMLQKEGFKQEA